MKKKNEKIITGVTLEPDVIDYLEKLGEREDRSRSWLINFIVREHAQRNGQAQSPSKAKATSKRAPRK